MDHSFYQGNHHSAMYAQSYNPLSITDPVHLVNMLANEKRRRKYLHSSPRRKSKLSSLQMIPTTYQEGGADEKELSQIDLMKKLKAEHTSEYNDDDRTSDYYHHSDCVPREISLVLSPSSSYWTSHQTQHQDQTTESCDDDSCLAANDVPHLIGVSFDSDKEEEDDDEKDYEDIK